MKTTMKQWFTNVYGAFFGVMILSFALTACKTDADELPTEEQPELTVQRRFDGERLVALAVCRVVDGKGISVKSFSQDLKQASYLPRTRFNTENQTPYIKYDFDFIQIEDALRFIAPKIDFPFLNEICGEGEIEVFLTSFKTFVYADETKDVNNLELYIPDDLIVFRGEWGIYTCMSNGGSWKNDDGNNLINSFIEYSSHKRFNGKAIEKDLTPPLYQFYVRTENNVTSLGCNKDNAFGNPLAYRGPWTELQGGDIVSSKELFSPDELSDLPEISQECTIAEIGDGFFMVSGKHNLKKIFFDEYTLFFVDKQPAKSTDFAEGNVITVTFDKLYEKYDPKVALANKIEK